MNRFVVLIGLAGALGACQSTDVAHRTVSAGATTAIAAIPLTSTHTCVVWAPPRPSLSQPPAHGSVAFSVEEVKPRSADNPCQGKPLQGTVVRYTPEKGFVGEDRLTVKYDFESNDAGGTGTFSQDYAVTVK